ncbi:MAG: hypothetical protein DDT32_01652 [Syntrophomonadaceae bacterium]|nr:hypothetical protein [Bacillota bacterium]
METLKENEKHVGVSDEGIRQYLIYLMDNGFS